MTSPIRSGLRSTLTTALKARDRATASTCRSALAAIDNAEAVATPRASDSGSADPGGVGVGSTEAARRELSERELAELVESEIAECRQAAAAVLAHDPDRAAELTRAAELLGGVLVQAAGG